jgi:hypothetical protein
MISKLLVLLDLEKQKQSLEDEIEKLKNIPKEMIYVSSVPDETVEDAIKDYEGSIQRMNIKIEKIKLLLA